MNTMNTLTRISPARDWIGIVASIGCAVHCAAMPFVIAYLPMLGLSFLADEGFHRWMTLACFAIALAAFVPGFRQHRRWVPGAIAVIGLSLITFAAFGIAGDCCVACEIQVEFES
ncbi:MerC domain-containing protein [Planctomycetes bacterium K23_9]|uniref:MerC mercury resistance protein n=1 Tax=Stieleria marina TaxID=1930275 RepID=A0A517NWB4_9BACT|nr:MerC mercury resistance protein [Planctomycetes bacterium K23_9]